LNLPLAKNLFPLSRYLCAFAFGSRVQDVTSAGRRARSHIDVRRLIHCQFSINEKPPQLAGARAGARGRLGKKEAMGRAGAPRICFSARVASADSDRRSRKNEPEGFGRKSLGACPRPRKNEPKRLGWGGKWLVLLELPLAVSTIGPPSRPAFGSTAAALLGLEGSEIGRGGMGVDAVGEELGLGRVEGLLGLEGQAKACPTGAW
jgi:hypothetical protein